MRKGKSFIISGPSGVGKSTVLKSLLGNREDIYFSVSATTRSPREGEVNGVHYHFIDADTFREWIAKDEFLEYAEYVGNFYGTPKKYVDAAMEEGNREQADSAYKAAVKTVDESVKKGILHKNTAARKKSSITRKLNKLA